MTRTYAFRSHWRDCDRLYSYVTKLPTGTNSIHAIWPQNPLWYLYIEKFAVVLQRLQYTSTSMMNSVVQESIAYLVWYFGLKNEC
jgi:hypothetical protein